jgi:L-iditol 2-dehydrogenase
MGHGVDGAFARYLVVRPDQLYRLPDAMSLEAGALSEPFAAVVQAVTEITQVRLGETAVVSGPGPIGLLCLKLLVAEGVQTIVAGTPGDAERLAAAQRLGAAHVVNVGERNLGEAVRDLTKGVGADVAFECSGHPDSVRGCLDSLRPMGRYTQVGICGRDIEFPMDQVFYKQLTVRGSVTYTAATWSRMMNIFAQGKVRLDDLVSTTLPITEWKHAFDMVADRGALKVLLYPVD